MQESSKLWAKLANFVTDVCSGRDPSHGFEHMQKVTRNAVKIAETESVTDDILRDIIVVAWLHDVEDHKYGSTKETRERIVKLLNEIYGDNDRPQRILDIISKISFSLEKKLRAERGSTGHEIFDLEGNDNLIRDIVSDADKLEAIGAIGLERCVEYTKHKNPNISKRDLCDAVTKHADEKLLILDKDGYIRTKEGHRMADPLVAELVNGLKDLEKSCL